MGTLGGLLSLTSHGAPAGQQGSCGEVAGASSGTLQTSGHSTLPGPAYWLRPASWEKKLV